MKMFSQSGSDKNVVFSNLICKSFIIIRNFVCWFKAEIIKVVTIAVMMYRANETGLLLKHICKLYITLGTTPFGF